jgi:hypothetical protein
MYRLTVVCAFEMPSFLQSTKFIFSSRISLLPKQTNLYLFGNYGAVFNSGFALLCPALRFHFAVECLCCLSGVLIGVRAPGKNMNVLHRLLK